ncbi:MAG: histidinol-phosphatase HisJ family protein [Alphaproteobacteria bacterium]|nr:histidinol-phosphatase HisJ family protein [Alphaproteobacteria bacterium]
MQNFTLHTHNNELRFDGYADAKTMIQKAQDLNFQTIGVSNHVLVNQSFNFSPVDEPMYFNDFNKATSAYLKHIEILENLKQEFKIDIKIGFECDFFTSKDWRNSFEKMIQQLPVDYLIGSNHFLKSQDESFLCNIYHLKKIPNRPNDEDIHLYTINHFKNIIECIKSGYFTFIAHLDYCTIFNLGNDSRYDVYKQEIIEILEKTKTPIEINTSGYDRINRPHPAPWIIEELSKSNLVPILISDDAHRPESIGQHFEEAEKLLKNLNYTNRFNLNMLKKAF